jgi:hypothetical protein
MKELLIYQVTVDGKFEKVKRMHFTVKNIVYH